MPLLGLIRHGETEWNRQGRMQGRADIPLTEDARHTLSGSRPPDELSQAEWYSSPLARAKETAAALGIAAPRLDDRLIETDWGGWQGKTIGDLRTAYGTAFLENEGRGRHFRPSNGESPADVIRRIHPFLAMIGQKEGPCAAITHKGVIRAVLALAYDWDMTAKEPVKLSWHAAHLFHIPPSGQPSPVQMNVPLKPKDGAP